MDEKRKAYRILVRKLLEKMPIWKSEEEVVSE
jgi:hypothetical protein